MQRRDRSGTDARVARGFAAGHVTCLMAGSVHLACAARQKPADGKCDHDEDEGDQQGSLSGQQSPAG
jgi:hypothetical protein